MKIPYQMTAAMSFDDRHAQMLHAINRGLPRLTPVDIDDSRTISLACYGPSLLDTWKDLTRPIISMSGATRFLAERGIIPDFHVDMDPRRHKVKHLQPPIDGVHYLMASVCPSETWDILSNQRVTLWHTYSGKHPKTNETTHDWVREHDPGNIVIHGGSTIGLTAMHIAGVLGYRHLEIHGMDGSFADGTRQSRHAGVHYGRQQNDQTTWDAEGVTYYTSKIMSNAVAETINTIKNFPIFCVFHGRGLTQALVREANVPNACTIDQAEKVAFVRRACIRIADIPTVSAAVRSAWDAFVDVMPKSAVTELITFKHQAEALRVHAKYNTGSVPIETAILLRALCDHYKPKVIAEIGTFIGLSTYALQASEALYTCDRDNDCLGADPKRHIKVHPFMLSTAMFQRMLHDGLAGKVDLFFFDGRIQSDDLPLIQRLSHGRTVYAFDDCSMKPGATKGIANTALLRPMLPNHAIIPPNPSYDGRSTLGVMIPTSVSVQSACA